MTSMRFLQTLNLRRERQQGDVARLLDRVAQAPLAGSTNARDAAWNDLAALGNERVQHLDVFVIDIVDLLDTEPAHFFAPEILLLLRQYRFVAPSGTLRRATWFSS